MQRILSDEHLRAAIENTIDKYRWGYEGDLDRVIDTGDALLHGFENPSYARGFAVRFRLDPVRAQERLQEIIAQAEEGGRRYIWITGPSSEPADVSDLLVVRGLPRTIVWDGLALRDLSQRFQHGEEATAEPLSYANAEEYALMNARDSGNEATYPERLAAAHRLIENGQREAQVWVGRVDGVAAGCAVLRVEEDGIAYLRNAFTLPEFRGRGVYLAMIEARIAFARAAGCVAAVVQAQIHSSSPVLRKRGFEPLCRLYGHMRMR